MTITRGAYVVKVDGRRIAAYAECRLAMLRARMEGGLVAWEREGFTATADEILTRLGA